MRILLVDADHALRHVLAEKLTREGYEVLEAGNGVTAWGYIEDPDSIGMLITDLYLPGIDGMTVAQKAREHHPDVPVLYISSTVSDEHLRQVPKPYAFLAKVFSREEFIRAVRALIAEPPHSS